MKYDTMMLDTNTARLKEIRNNYGTEELSTLNRAFDLADYADEDQLKPAQIKILMCVPRPPSDPPPLHFGMFP